MDVPNGLIVIIIIYGVLYFFDTFFKTCAHYPYIEFLKGTGIELKFLQIRWKTTAFNRLIVWWGVKWLRFLELWFKLGIYASLALLPVSVVILFISIFHDVVPPSTKYAPTLEPIIPYVNVPASEMLYYSLSLLLCSVIHELGHALASVTEDVHIDYIGANIFFIFPVAYVSLSTEKLFSLPKPKILKILCAGIWHNLILTFFCYLIYITLPLIFSLFFTTGEGVYISEVVKNAPVTGERGFLPGDTIVKINDCSVLDENSWYDCLQKMQHSIPSFCLNSDLIHELEEGVPIRHDQGIVDCCGKSRPKNLCFEYLETNSGILELPPYACLPARDVIMSSLKFCSIQPHLCPENTHCFRPVLKNSTNLFKVERLRRPDIIFIGLASDLSRFIGISPYVPKYIFISSVFPDVTTKMVGYICVFSLGLGIINVLPCAFMDGQYIINMLVPLILRNNVTEEKTKIISCVVTIFTTFLLIAHLLYVVYMKIFL